MTLKTQPERSLFDGTDWDWASNFAESRVTFDMPGEHWNGWEAATVEHAYQAAKTLDKSERAEILFADSPGRAKRLGNRCTLRPDWNEIKTEVMRRHLRGKFMNRELAKLLLGTTGPLVEWNVWHDNVWGVCLCESCPGTGENRLGELLVEVRDEFLGPMARRVLFGKERT